MLVAQLPRNLHPDTHQQVALARHVQLLNALSLQAEFRIVLGSFRDAVLHRTVQGRHIHFTAQSRLSKADGQVKLQVEALPAEQLMRLHQHVNVQVAVCAAPDTGLALVAHHNGLSIVNTGRHLHRCRTAFPYPTGAAAGRALVCNHRTCAAAVGAGAHGGHPPAALTNLTGTMTGGTGGRTGARLGAGTVAGFTIFVTIKFEGLFTAVGRFLEGNAKLIPQVITLHRAVPLCGGCTAVEELVEDAVEATHATEVKAAGTAEGIAASHVGGIKAIAVVLLTLLGVT